ncbi:MAG TPA: hypothetical protein VFS60_19825, partial [Thermoanaerobaculia bacterium]|nr:hypothetical protein [Thermoanaerobaculia bacterium]
TNYFTAATPAPPQEVAVPTVNVIFNVGQEVRPSPPATVPASTTGAQCIDASGRKGAISAMVFLASYNWVLGSTELVEFDDQLIPYFPTVLRQEPIQEVLAQAQAVVTVGMASCESSLGFLVEKRRARQRAEQLVRWVEESRSRLPSGGTRMRTVIPLSLGRYTKPCDDSAAGESSRQRRIVLIAVTNNPEDLDVESCLRSGIATDPSLKFLTDNYSDFDFDVGWKS